MRGSPPIARPQKLLPDCKGNARRVHEILGFLRVVQALAGRGLAVVQKGKFLTDLFQRIPYGRATAVVSEAGRQG
jgi:hypothetical protein